jgi:hypothetical protein
MCNASLDTDVDISSFPETSGKTLEEIAGLFGDVVAETIEDAGQHLDELQDIVAKEAPEAAEHGMVKTTDSKHVENAVEIGREK